MGQRIGYMRVSTEEQDNLLQRSGLERAGCVRIYEDVLSGSVMAREGLRECMASLSPGDTLVVWKLDRIGRSSGDAIKLIDGLIENGVGVVSLTDHIDTSTPAGMAMIGMQFVFARLERDMIRQRTKAGMRARMELGVKMGPPRRLSEKYAQIAEGIRSGKSYRDVARSLGVSKTTVHRVMKGIAA